MLKKMCTYFVAAAATVLVPISAFAQDAAPTIDLGQMPDWSSLTESVTAAIMVPALIGIGIGLTLWCIVAGARALRRTAQSACLC